MSTEKSVYVANWKIGLTAESPEEAARKAKEAMRDEDSKVIEVETEDGSEIFTID